MLSERVPTTVEPPFPIELAGQQVAITSTTNDTSSGGEASTVGDSMEGIAASQQPTEESKKPPTPPHTGLRALFSGVVDDVKNLPSRGSTYILLGGGVVALAVHPFDSTLNAHLASHYTLVNDIFAPAKYYGDTPLQVGLSLATYGWGRIAQQPKVSHLGMDLLQAQIITNGIVDVMKITVRRDRPDNSQGNWNFSFPSGHAAQTFTAATVLERHLGWKKAALAYLIATYVSASRLHDNVHYVSDVAFGAAVGTMVGRTVTRHGPNAWTFTPTSVPGRGIAILAMHTSQPDPSR